MRTIKQISFIFISLCLWGLFPFFVDENILDLEAAGASKTFAAKVAVIIPMATCSNPLTSSACINCNIGTWDDITLAAVFGGASEVETYACKMPTFIPNGAGTCAIGEVMFGPGAANQLAANDGATTNVWCQMQ